MNTTIRDIILEDRTSLMKWSSVVDELITSDVHKGRIQYLMKNESHYGEVILQTLDAWISCGGQRSTWWDLERVLRRHDLSGLAGDGS